MILTSYFGNMRNIEEGTRLVSICRNAPDWFKGEILYQTTISQREYNGEPRISNTHFESIKKQVIIVTDKPVNKYSIKLLAPMSQMYNDFLINGNAEVFEKEYKEKVLGRLDPIRVWEVFKGANVCLLCHEPNDGRVCHRHYARNWFTEAGIEVSEACGKQ